MIKRSIPVNIELTRSEFVEEFWSLDSHQMAAFFSALGDKPTIDLSMQLEYVRQSPLLYNKGRMVMEKIGEYAWNEPVSLSSDQKYMAIVKAAHNLAMMLDNDIGMDKPELTHLWQALGEIGIER